MIVTLIAICAFTIIALYTGFSLFTRSAINVLTPYFVILLPSRFILETLYIAMVREGGSDFAYTVVYTSYLLDFFGLILGYFLIRPTLVVSIPFFSFAKASPKIAWALICMSLLLYSPIVLRHPDMILAPREMYQATRTGYGPLFFGSQAIAYLAYVAFLLSPKRGGFVGQGIFIIVLILNLFLHGNKASVVNLLFIYAIYLVYIGRKRVSLSQFLLYVVAISITILGLFYATLSANMKENFLLGVASYSDYTRNAMLVVDEPPPLQYGKLTLENNFVSVIPRALYPEKPKNFGTFYLAERYYPEWFQMDSGSPAFGFGVFYADFGLWSLLFVFLTSIAIGCCMKLTLNRLMKYESPPDFIILLFFCGVPFLELGAGYQVLPHIALACGYVLVSAYIGRQKMAPAGVTPLLHTQRQLGID